MRFVYPADMADEEEDDAPVSEKPSEKPKAVEKVEKVEKVETKAATPAPAESDDDEPDKPVSKSVEWGIAIAMMVVLVGFLFMMIYLMRSARSAVM